MEKKSKSYLLFLLIIIVVLALSIYKVVLRHQEKEYLVVNSYIKEQALDCYNDNKCEGEITLKELIQKEYIEKVIDPVTKDYIDENTCLKKDDLVVKFCDE